MSAPPSKPSMQSESESAADTLGGLALLAILSLIAGALAGLVAAAFRLALEQADRFRELVLVQAHTDPQTGLPLVLAATALATALAAWLVRRLAPQASGSGIPHVEAVLHGELPPAPARLIPVKFLGGLLAIGSGLALGREGPSVQMGPANWCNTSDDPRCCPQQGAGQPGGK